jgi:hypothetical protein
MATPAHGRQHSGDIVPPSTKAQNPAQAGFCAFVDMASKRLNRVKDYLSRFWQYYQNNSYLQKALE